MYESESDFDFQRAEELNDRIIELSVQADELRRTRRERSLSRVRPHQAKAPIHPIHDSPDSLT